MSPSDDTRDWAGSVYPGQRFDSTGPGQARPATGFGFSDGCGRRGFSRLGLRRLRVPVSAALSEILPEARIGVSARPGGEGL